MRRMRVIGSALGVLVVGSACATTTGNSVSSLRTTPAIKQLSRTEQVAWRDSVYAQAVADQEGPGASIRAEFTNLAGSRRVRGVFTLEADAYVVIGHIDASGVLRIMFPTDPSKDDGFVKGNKAYQTQEAFAGFGEEYRFRAAQYRRVVRNYDAYDGNLGFMFIIASWRPMRFDRFSQADSWDTFELTDDSYLRDPRPAIYELASLLVGENREAYTVKFARYSNTSSGYAFGPWGSSAYSAFNYCAGYQPLGFAYDPLADGFLDPFMAYAYGNFPYGMSFSRRGVNYYFDSARGCYTSGTPFVRFNVPRRIASGGPVIPPTDGSGTGPTAKRPLDPDGLRVPFNPRPAGVSVAAPTGRVVETNARGDLPLATPTYRQRGVVSGDDGMPSRREPRMAARETQERTRPSIQDMVGRRPAGNDNGSRVGAGYSRSNTGGYGSTYDRPTPRDRNSSGSSGFDGGSRYTGGSSPSTSGGGSSVGASSASTGGSAAAGSASGAAGAGSGPAGSSSTGGRPPR